MLEIIEYTDSLKTSFEKLKASVWSGADKEHYGVNQPKFFRDTFTLVAKDDEEIIGYVTVIIDSGVAQIEPLMVAIDRKEQGIGTKLLKASEDKARSLDVHKIWLETGSDWSARQFYEKRGYAVRAILPNHTGRRDFVLMDKMLS